MLVGGWATLPQKKTCIIVIACNSNPQKKKVNDHFVYQLSYGHAIWPTASVLCKTFRYSKPSKNVLANVGFTLAAISLPFWDGLSNIPCQCSGKSNMYPKHVHDTLGDKWRVHNNYLVDYILIHAPKGHHRKSGRSYRIRFSWDVHFLRKNSCALLANPKAVSGRVASPLCACPTHKRPILPPNNESFVASRNGMKQPFSRSNPFRKQVETIHGHCLDPVAGVD